MKMSFRAVSLLPCLALLLAVAPAAHATNFSISGQVWQESSFQNVSDGLAGESGSPTAVFTLTNTSATNLFNLNSNNAGGDYTLSNFLTSGGDTLNYISGSSLGGNSIDNNLFVFTGNTTLASNTVYSFEHDDGLLLYLNGSLVVNEGGPTSASTTTLCVGTPGGSPTCNYSIANTSGSESFTLDYAEVDGPPAVLETSLPLTNSAPTPEPSSLTLLGTGVLAFAGMVRRRFVA
jgi:hypothetical protein